MRRKYNFLSIVIVSWIMVIFVLATHNMPWYLWIFIAIPILERGLVSVALWFEGQIIRAMAQEAMKQHQYSQTPPLGPPNVP